MHTHTHTHSLCPAGWGPNQGHWQLDDAQWGGTTAAPTDPRRHRPWQPASQADGCSPNSRPGSQRANWPASVSLEQTTRTGPRGLWRHPVEGALGLCSSSAGGGWSLMRLLVWRVIVACWTAAHWIQHINIHQCSDVLLSVNTPRSQYYLLM